MKLKLSGAIAALAFLACSGSALAQDVEFTLTNASSHTLTYFYASPSSDESWGDDLFAEIGVLEPGYEGVVFIGDGSDECLYDFRFETAQGGELDVYDIDICALGAYTVTD